MTLTVSRFAYLLIAAELSVFFLGSTTAMSQAAVGSWDAPGMGNPFLPGYFADGDIECFNGTFYLYATTDGNRAAGPAPCVWISKDFINWTAQLTSVSYIKTFFYAPAVCYANGQYYMYYSTNGTVHWCEHVATSNSPTGPWTDKGEIVNSGDGQPFVDTDGTPYLLWAGPAIQKLNNDMISLAGRPTGFPPALKGEGSYMFKRNNIYYTMTSGGNYGDSTYHIHYATSPTALGPYTYRGDILNTSADDTIDGPGHHSILNYNGTYYIVYHRHDNPRTSGSTRQECIDLLSFDADGLIRPVAPTHTGVGPLGTLSDKRTDLAFGKTATSSSDKSAAYSAAKAVDHNNGTRWSAARGVPQWLKVDLGQTYTVAECQTSFEYAAEWYKYRLQYSMDNSTWKTFADRSDNTAQASPYKDVNHVTARYLMITVIGSQAGHTPSIWGFKVFGSSGANTSAPSSAASPAGKG